jgi:hypothetical protein
LLRLKGIAGRDDYTKERRKWQDSLDAEENKKEVYQTAKGRKKKEEK